MEITTLGSGSKGNSLVLKEGRTVVLIDAGLSLEATLQRLDILFIDPRDIRAIVVTHVHGDHVRSVRRLANRLHTAVHAHSDSFAHPSLARIKTGKPFENADPFSIGEMEFQPVPLSHDARPTFGFTVRTHGGKFGVATDLGRPTRHAERMFQNCNALLLEFNHDLEMLQSGPYPWRLKNRVASGEGHLSNQQSAAFLRQLLHARFKHLILGHLSETNNRNDIAREAAERVLVREGLGAVSIQIAPQHAIGQTVSF